jgi:ATP-dependent Clp protease adapter protein ClpS
MYISWGGGGVMPSVHYSGSAFCKITSKQIITHSQDNSNAAEEEDVNELQQPVILRPESNNS